ncbi:uncharacterized protein LOC110665867 isoform X1 [Hevea brasiliensis]|uniref:uncharacterized protein LOC110665867 isoform X1 n=1 Tax=Hevea brasiliensis TaxID=3981 RepID=UPI0025E43BE8|nr:uncharacterized protein LOC110665867 isoform X1 [Hevea brasiliensis]XP_058001255.1 uncharacterized protein LOC110665867 isoform X1 [Hevea brasiliensis]
MMSSSEVNTDELFEYAMNGQWSKIVEAYQNNPRNQTTKITDSEDTALHIAVETGQTEIVSQLVETIRENASTVLGLKNKRGNTALHIAAEIGNVKVCDCMASKSAQLISDRNEEGRTPLFLAVSRGKMEAFICLQEFSKGIVGFNTAFRIRDNDGNTILHSAIIGENFDLALKIMKDYPELMDYRNRSGEVPLNILASKPHAFKSSSRLGLFDTAIYNCIIVGKPKEAAEKDSRASGIETYCRCPPNYGTCMSFIGMMEWFLHISLVLLKKLFGGPLLANSQSRNCNVSDLENPSQRRGLGAGTAGSSSSTVKCKSNADIEIEESTATNRSIANSGTGLTEKAGQEDVFPPNYVTPVVLFKLVMTAIMVILGLGFSRIRKIKEKKEIHKRATQVMNQLVQHASNYKYKDNGKEPARTGSGENGISQPPETCDREVKKETTIPEVKKETAILTAARMGIREMVEKILDTFPVAIMDVDADNKNVVLLAVEHRQTQVYTMLMKKAVPKDIIFCQVDKDGNSALHLAAKFGDYKPWLIPGAALQMQWEYKWYKFVKKSKPRNFFARYDKKGLTAKQIFMETHKELAKNGREWLTKTSEACSVVAALIATVAFATSTTIPGSFNENNGEPNFADEAPFTVFAISSVVALCCSVTALVFFLSILTSRFEEKDFASELPNKLLLGLTSLFSSIAFMLVSFSAGHFFVLQEKLRYATYPIYGVTCLPVTLFALGHLSLYSDLTKAIFKRVPQRSFKVFAP